MKSDDDRAAVAQKSAMFSRTLRNVQFVRLWYASTRMPILSITYRAAGVPGKELRFRLRHNDPKMYYISSLIAWMQVYQPHRVKLTPFTAPGCVGWRATLHD